MNECQLALRSSQFIISPCFNHLPLDLLYDKIFPLLKTVDLADTVSINRQFKKLTDEITVVRLNAGHQMRKLMLTKKAMVNFISSHGHLLFHLNLSKIGHYTACLTLAIGVLSAPLLTPLRLRILNLCKIQDIELNAYETASLSLDPNAGLTC